MVDKEVFPLELTHPRFDFLLCELGTGTLRNLIIHLSEGANTDSSAHREFTMLDRAGLLQPGLVIIHSTAIRDQDFADMARGSVGLVWSPRSNNKLYGSTKILLPRGQPRFPSPSLLTGALPGAPG